MEIEENYEKAIEEIESLNIDEYLKIDLLDMNHKLYNLKISNIETKLKIIIENLSSDIIDILINQISYMIQNYELCENEPKIYKEDDTDFRNKNLIIIDDFNLFEDDVLYNNYRFNKFKDKINRNNCSILIACEEKIEKHYDRNFNENLFNEGVYLNICGKDYENQEIISRLKEMYKKNKIKYKIKDQLLNAIIDQTLENEECFKSGCASYLYDYSYKQKIILGKEVIDVTCFKKIKTVEKKDKNVKLDDLIGLKNVKKEVTSLKNYLIFRKKLKKEVEDTYLNMFFLGNPGTGKTTVARIYAGILHELGYIKENKVVEIIPTDLMANYVGQTKDKTRKILADAKGGVLFIDEAYLIGTIDFKDRGSYMKEAVVELIKYMEDPENVIIFAGYPKETLKIYDSNPGIKSRVCKDLYFDDYTDSELLKILKSKLKNLGMKTNKETDIIIKEIFNEEKNKKNFGNARFVNVFMQKLLVNHANQKLENETFTITKEDITREEEKNYQMGFIGE